MKRFLIYYLIFFLIPVSFYTFLFIFFIHTVNFSRVVQAVLFFLSFILLFLFYLYPGFLYTTREKIMYLLGESQDIKNLFHVFSLSFLAIIFIILNTSLYNLKYYILPVYIFEIIFPFYAKRR